MRAKILTGVLLLGLSIPMHAIDYGLMKNEIGVDGGVVSGVSGNDFNDILNGAVVYGFHYTHFITPRFGLGFQFDYIDMGDNSANSWDYVDLGGGGYMSSYANISQENTDYSLMMTGRYNVVEKGLAIPYLIGGAGLNRFQSQWNAAGWYSLQIPDPFNPGEYISDSNSVSESGDEKSINFAGTVGLGVDMMISEVFRIGVEGRYNYYVQTALDEVDNIEMLMGKAKISWYFN